MLKVDDIHNFCQLYHFKLLLVVRIVDWHSTRPLRLRANPAFHRPALWITLARGSPQMASELVAALSRGSQKKFSPNGSFYNMLPFMVQLSSYRHTVGRSKAPNCLVVTPIGLYHINTRASLRLLPGLNEVVFGSNNAYAEPAASTAAAAFAALRFLTSPCLPFCVVARFLHQRSSPIQHSSSASAVQGISTRQPPG